MIKSIAETSVGAVPERDARVTAAQRQLLEKYVRREMRRTVVRNRIPPRTPGVSPPLSFAQQQLWLHGQLAQNLPVYNEPMTIYRKGKLEISALERTMAEIIDRHEIWRTTFKVVDGQAIQVVHSSPRAFTLPVVDLRDLPRTQRDARAFEISAKEAAKPFDLQHGPLLRATLLMLGDEEFQLFLCFHHIIVDGVSGYVGFFPELIALYEAFSRDQSSPLPAPRVQYADYAVWQRNRAQTQEEVTRQLTYWVQKLGHELPVLQWPNDRPRPAAQTFRGSLQSWTLPRSLVDQLKSLSRKEGVTLFMTLLAGFVALLNRYTGQEDIIVGTVVAGRKHVETETMLGYFLNPLPLRIDLSGNPGFLELLARVRQVVSGALSHDEVPFDHLVKHFHKVRDLSRNPLFQIVIALEAEVPAHGPGWDVVLGATPTGASKLDLYINLHDRAEGLLATITYNPDLFEDATITRMVGHWQTVLGEALVSPGTKISDLPLLTKAERHQMLTEWNATQQPYPQACVHELFDAQAQKTPDAVALVSVGTQLTYRQLNQRANQLAHYLCKQGVGSEGRVAVYMERSVEMVVGLLGILKTGAAYVPIDPAYPPDRVRFMLQDAKPTLILTRARGTEVQSLGVEKAICLERDWAGINKESLENTARSLTPDHLAYVMYTSGSTGKPKGVMGKHRGAVNRFHWMLQAYPFEADEVCCQKTSVSFVDSIWEIFGPLLQGTKTVIVPDDIVKDPTQLVEFLARHRVTRLVLVPSLLRAILDGNADLQRRLPRLKYWVTSGEALSLELAQRFSIAMPDAVLLNLYGSSEVAADSTHYRVERTDSLTCLPIGRPIANTQIYILDRNLQPVPIRVPGELYVGGDGLARGYFERPELTAERFIPNPFTTDPNARLYRTGDHARYLPDGTIEYLGHTDNQVKIRGFRIELGEIEAVLGGCPDLKQVVVTVRNDHRGNQQLSAYVTPAPGRTPKPEELQAYAKQQLPEYMVPSMYVLLDSLPLLPNGKIDRSALPGLFAPLLKAPITSASQVERQALRRTDLSGTPSALAAAPDDWLEQSLLKIWRTELGIPSLGIRDSFFDFGGHSLIAARVMSEVQKMTERKVPLSALFRTPTVEGFAAVIRAGSEVNMDPVLMEIQQGATGVPFFAIATPGVDTLGYALLAHHMPDRRVYKIQGHHRPGNPFVPLTSEQLASLATEYVAAMRSAHPEGPYCIGAMCEGVHIAEKMVIVLEDQGQEVAVFVIVDSWVLQNRMIRWRAVLNHYDRRLRSITELPKGQRWVVFRQEFSRKLRGLFSRGSDAPDPWDQAYWPGKGFRPQTFRAPVLLFKRSKYPYHYVKDPQLGWGERSLSGVETYVVNSAHENMLREPAVKTIAQRLDGRLKQLSSHSLVGRI